jgi:hypothetical protein
MVKISLWGFIKHCVMLDSDGYKSHPKCHPYWAKVERKLFEGERPCFVGWENALLTIKPESFAVGAAKYVQ